MAWTLVNNVHGTKPSGGNPVASLPSTTAGNLLVAIVGGSAVGSNSASFTMPAGWTVISPLYIATTSTSHADLGFAYYCNNPGGITSVTATWNDGGGNTSGWIELMEWSGADTGSCFDSTNGVINNSVIGAGTALTASLTPTNTGSLVLAAFSSLESGAANWGTDSGWTQDDVFNFTGWITAVAVQHIVDAGATTESPSINTPINTVVAVLGVLAFNAAGSAPAINPFPAGYGYPTSTEFRQLLGGFR